MGSQGHLHRAWSRRAVLACVLSVLGACAVQTAMPASSAAAPNILFVCQLGTVKSAVAREHLRRRATERGIAVRVHSRGITPADHRSPPLVRSLQEDGIDADREPLMRLTPTDIRAADIVVLFDKLPGNFEAANARDWSDLVSMNADYAPARSDLLKRIDRLLDELQARDHAGFINP